MTINALTNAISGLTTSQASIDVISNNVANASVDGYTRKTAEQASIAVQFSGVGVRVERVTRYVDQKLLRDFRVQNSIESYLNTKSSYLEPIANFHGDPSLQSNLHGQLSDLKAAFVDLTSDPNSSVGLRQVLNIAERYAETFNNHSKLILAARQKAEDDINGLVDNINTALKEIESLNRRISSKKLTGEDTAELEDKRDLAAKELSKYMEITYFEDGSGNLVVQTNKGHVMVDQKAQQVSYSKSPITYASSYPENLNGMMLSQGNGQAAIDLASFPIGGQLGALFELRDNELAVYQAFADELAHKTAERFETYGLRLFTDGDGIVPVDDPTQYFGFSAKIQVNSRIIDDPSFIQRGTDPANGNLDAGSNEIINDVIDEVFGTDPVTIPLSTVTTTTTTPADPALSTQILANNPIAYWRLDEAAGTTATNLGTLGAAVNGTYSGGVAQSAAPLYPNGGNNSTQFGGVNGTILIPDSPSINLNTVPQRTVELVFNADNVSPRQVLYEEGATVNSLGIYIDGGNLYVATRDSGEWGPFNISTPINAGQDYHVSLVLDTVGSGTFTGYLNGVPFGTGATPTSLDPHSGNIGIGSSQQGLWFHDGANGATGFYFQGRISDVALYNTALTAGELLNHANSLTAVATSTTTTTTTGGTSATQNFRTTNLGYFAGVDLDTNGVNISLLDFAQSFILRQTGDASAAQSEMAVETSYKNDVQKRLLDSSAVNMDEELGRLIKYRQSYSAASQMIVTLDEMFQDLLSAFN